MLLVVEHEVLKGFAKDYSIIGIAYKDSVENIANFFKELGNPYDEVFYDFLGKASINLGLYGVPETFLLTKMAKFYINM